MTIELNAEPPTKDGVKDLKQVSSCRMHVTPACMKASSTGPAMPKGFAPAVDMLMTFAPSAIASSVAATMSASAPKPAPRPHDTCNETNNVSTYCKAHVVITVAKPWWYIASESSKWCWQRIARRCKSVTSPCLSPLVRNGDISVVAATIQGSIECGL